MVDGSRFYPRLKMFVITCGLTQASGVLGHVSWILGLVSGDIMLNRKFSKRYMLKCFLTVEFKKVKKSVLLRVFSSPLNW